MNPTRSTTRRELLRTTFALTTAAAFARSGKLPAAPTQAPVLRARRLAWAGIQLQLPSGSLFIDPLIDKNEWGDALKDELVPVAGNPGDRFVLITHRHPDHCDPQAIRQALGDTGVLGYAAQTGIPNVPGEKQMNNQRNNPIVMARRINGISLTSAAGIS